VDSLQISGKLYISPGRAAKEYGHDSGYIEQLVHAGKIKGQKVGGSWFAEEGSLKKYLDEGGDLKPAEKTAHKKTHTEKISKLRQISPEEKGAVIVREAEQVSQASAPQRAVQGVMHVAVIEEEKKAAGTGVQKSEKTVSKIIRHTEKAMSPLSTVPVARESKVKINLPFKEPPLLTYLKDEEDLEPDMPHPSKASLRAAPESRHVSISSVPALDSRAVSATRQAQGSTKNPYRRALTLILLGALSFAATVGISLSYIGTM